MPSSPSKSSCLASSSSPSLKRVRSETTLAINNYCYQQTRPEGCISKQEAIKEYRLKQSDFNALEPRKTVPNPHSPSKKAYWFHPDDIDNYLIAKNSGTASFSDNREGTSDSKVNSKESPKKVKKPTTTSSSTIARPVERKRTMMAESAAGLVQVPRKREEGESPNKKRKAGSVAYFEIFDDGSTLDLPLKKD